MKVLISGFGPFAEHTQNPTEDLINRLRDSKFPYELAAVLLPVSYKDSFLVLEERIKEFSPDWVISFGLAGDRNAISLEQIAVNEMNSKTADNQGVKLEGVEILHNSENSLHSTLPLEQILLFSEDSPIPYEISQNAGRFVCNALMYKALHYFKDSDVKAGFIHIPPTIEHNKVDDGHKFVDIFESVYGWLIKLEHF